MTKVSKKAKIRNQYNQVGHIMGKWQKHKKHHNKRAKMLTLSQQVTTRLQWTDKKAWQKQNINNKMIHKRSTALEWSVKNLLDGLN